MACVLIVLPVYNEEKQLAASVRTLIDFLKSSRFPYTYTILIADNIRTDATARIGRRLAQALRTVRYLRLETRGRGFALRLLCGCNL